MPSLLVRSHGRNVAWITKKEWQDLEAICKHLNEILAGPKKTAEVSKQET